jgi:hypothetical protein
MEDVRLPRPGTAPSTGGARGLFAARSYEQGDLILEESPLLTATETASSSGAWELTRALLMDPEHQELRAWVRAEFGSNPQIFVQGGNPHDWSPEDAELCRRLAAAAGLPEQEVKRTYAAVGMINLTVSLPGSPEPFVFGIYRLLSYVNHSCEPSAALDLRGPVRRLVAARNIREGQEITMLYLHESMLQLVDVRAYLQQVFGFECRCSRCAGIPSNLPGIKISDNIA